MRIGSATMTLNYVNRLNNAYRQQANLIEQGDGSKFHRPSDDPVEYARTMRYKNDLSSNDRYTRNVEDGLSWMKASDTKMQEMVGIMNTIKEKTTDAANETNNEKDIAAIGAEVEALVEELVNLANTDIGGRYLFSGQRDTIQPYTIVTEEVMRADIKTLDEKQTATFGYYMSATSGNVEQITADISDASKMLKMTGDDGNSYYLNLADNSVYTADFVENGYQAVINDTGLSGKALYEEIYNNHRVGNLTINSTNGGLFSEVGTTDGYFTPQGQVVTGATTTFVPNGTVTGPTTLEFDMATQKVVTYSGDDNKISMKMVDGANDPTKDAINATGVDVFGTDIFGTGGAAVLNDLYSIVQHMKDGDTKWLSADGMALADSSYSQVLKAETELGAVCANYNISQEMLENQSTLITEDITNLSGTDVADLAVQLQMASMIYSMSLSMGSKILQNSLADYL